MKNPSVRDTLKGMGLAPSKSRGQNFLKDQNVIERITDTVLSFSPENQQANILEIGPGLGALTKPLLNRGARVWAVEFDRGLADNLSQLDSSGESLTVINDDILRFDPSEIAAGCKDSGLIVCGNLPYNISSPILFWFLERLKIFSGAVFMLQKEMADRIAAKEGCKDYGRLAAALRLWCNVKRVISVAPSAFHPRPRVDSAVLSMKALNNEPGISVEKFGHFTAIAFAARRKTIFNNLSKIYGREKTLTALAAMGLAAGARAESLAPEILAQLALKLSA